METLDVAFDKKHSPAGRIYIPEQNQTRYGDGAICSGSGLSSVMTEPPRDAHECARLVALFYTVALDQAVKRFRARRDDLGLAASTVRKDGGNVPDRQSLVELRTLQQEVMQLRAKHAEAMEQVERTLPPDIAARRAAKAASQHDAEVFLSELDKIQV